MHYAPPIDDWSAPFHAALERGELLYPACTACRHALPYGARCCPTCGGTAIAWRRSGGLARLCARVVYRRSFAAAFPAPYAVAQVQLSEGPRLPVRCPLELAANTGDTVRLDVRDGAVIAMPLTDGDTHAAA
ncbi:OB-fold domain-containing protein [Aerosticca soli]|jgi:uncharacterized OB-fold protein|uniref:DUF35 domain-containing protein n=1 Tax=Aerosticca soli TaxID=2010829 RepID=A0A2Z6E3N7_9GAMM|nr:OB-fold domain-containing protein [Aerosticca soli]MDI3262005.1 hypothetical protein [Fulvimonas sp.]BBD79532.1 hypothetical protein ALSL_0867 [Aerosticca soli]